MNILVVSSNYPSLKTPTHGIFVYKIVQEFIGLGNEVTVISPLKHSLKKPVLSSYGIEKAKVIRPKTFSFSNKQIGKWNSFTLTRYFQARAIRKAFKKLNEQPDAIYCHFIISALYYSQAFPNADIPIFAAVGENAWIDSLRKNVDSSFYNQTIDRVTGFIAVSPIVKEKLINIGVPEHKITVEPNGTDLTLYKPKDKVALRKKYNFPLDKKIVLYIGGFTDAKGAFRVQEAVKTLDDDIGVIYLGKGKEHPKDEKTLFIGIVSKEQVADFMALSDVFVLPTLHEGSSNSIVEAMASGLPIVSSDIPEIHVQCTSDFSILVDPMSINAIAEALKTILNNDELCHQMSLNAREHAKKFDIKERAKRIMKFVESNIK